MAGRTIQVKVRMPVGFHRKLMRDAESGGQTLNAEILRRLEASFDAGDMAEDRAANTRVLEEIKKLARDQETLSRLEPLMQDIRALLAMQVATKRDKDD
jgi:hypothetical protein